MERMIGVFQSGINRKNSQMRCVATQGERRYHHEKTTLATLVLILFALLLSCTRTNGDSVENSLYGEIERAVKEATSVLSNTDNGMKP